MNLIGDIRAEIGLGQSMRLLANELELSKIPFGIYNFQLDGNVRRGDHSFEHRMREDYPYRVNLFHVNPQEVGLAYLYLNKDIWRDRYNIAFWLWELEEFPQEYQEAIKFFRRDLDALGICEQQYPQGDRQAGVHAAVLCDGRKRRKLRQGGLWTSGGQILISDHVRYQQHHGAQEPGGSA